MSEAAAGMKNVATFSSCQFAVVLQCGTECQPAEERHIIPILLPMTKLEKPRRVGQYPWMAHLLSFIALKNVPAALMATAGSGS